MSFFIAASAIIVLATFFIMIISILRYFFSDPCPRCWNKGYKVLYDNGRFERRDCDKCGYEWDGKVPL
jgi:Zn ribbon nucleic-acid-binding protein